MSAALSLLYGLGAWAWLLLAVLLFALETVVPGIHFLWFGLASLATGAVALLTGMSWQWQMLVFAVLAVASMLLARRFASPDRVKSDQPGLNQRGAEYVGRLVTVEEPIRAGRGKVRVGDTLWIAEGPEAAAGTRVKIIGTNGTVLLVERT